MDKKIKALINEYAGDKAWGNFVYGLGITEEQHTPIEELRAVIACKLGNNESRAIAWFQKSIPALDGRIPDELLTQDYGIIVLRSLAMRMP